MVHGVLPRAVGATALAGLACVGYGTVVERRWYRLRRLRVPGVLARPGTLRVLHVSDLHLAPGQDHRIAFLATLEDLDHDLVVATGDLLGATEMEDTTTAALAPLTSRERPGLVVLGSSDIYAPEPKSPFSYFTAPDRRSYGATLDTGRLVEQLTGHGYRTLRDEVVTVDTPAGRVVAGGFDDPHLDTTVIPAARDLAPPADADGGPGAIARLGVVHAPYLAALDVLVDAGYDLLLAGHTHGGQVRLPGVGALTTNCDLPLDQARGLSSHRGRALHVSAGLGHNRYFPFRFTCRPEATLLELTG